MPKKKASTKKPVIKELTPDVVKVEEVEPSIWDNYNKGIHLRWWDWVMVAIFIFCVAVYFNRV